MPTILVLIKGDSCYEVMTIFSEVSMCLWWPGKTAAGQKGVYEDISVLGIHVWVLEWLNLVFKEGLSVSRNLKHCISNMTAKNAGYVNT